MTIADIKKMNVKERLQAMELLWDSLLEDENMIESPSWHEDVLNKRKGKIEKNEAKFISLNELKASRKLSG